MFYLHIPTAPIVLLPVMKYFTNISLLRMRRLTKAQSEESYHDMKHTNSRSKHNAKEDRAKPARRFGASPREESSNKELRCSHYIALA
jgi:hypothetical protein